MRKNMLYINLKYASDHMKDENCTVHSVESVKKGSFLELYVRELAEAWAAGYAAGMDASSFGDGEYDVVVEDTPI